MQISPEVERLRLHAGSSGKSPKKEAETLWGGQVIEVQSDKRVFGWVDAQLYYFSSTAAEKPLLKCMCLGPFKLTSEDHASLSSGTTHLGSLHTSLSGHPREYYSLLRNCSLATRPRHERGPVSEDAWLAPILAQEGGWPESASQVFVLIDMRVNFSTHQRDPMLHYKCLLALGFRAAVAESVYQDGLLLR